MWDDAKQLNAVAAALAFFAALGLLWGALAWALRQPPFEFRTVIVRGSLERVSTAHLEAAIRGELTGTFFTMNLDRARTSLARVPWVRNVALRRQWPQRLEVTIEEHAPLARWNDAGLVNTEGEAFVADYNGELPQFDGPDGTAAQVAARFREWSEALLPLALTLEGIRLSPRGGWRLAARGAGGMLAIELGREARAFCRGLRTHDRGARARRNPHRARGSALPQRIRGPRARFPRARDEEGRMSAAARAGRMEQQW
jgi:cell division protein FtsQ